MGSIIRLGSVKTNKTIKGVATPCSRTLIWYLPLCCFDSTLVHMSDNNTPLAWKTLVNLCVKGNLCSRPVYWMKVFLGDHKSLMVRQVLLETNRQLFMLVGQDGVLALSLVPTSTETPTDASQTTTTYACYINSRFEGEWETACKNLLELLEELIQSDARSIKCAWFTFTGVQQSKPQFVLFKHDSISGVDVMDFSMVTTICENLSKAYPSAGGIFSFFTIPSPIPGSCCLLTRVVEDCPHNVKRERVGIVWLDKSRRYTYVDVARKPPDPPVLGMDIVNRGLDALFGDEQCNIHSDGLRSCKKKPDLDTRQVDVQVPPFSQGTLTVCLKCNTMFDPPSDETRSLSQSPPNSPLSLDAISVTETFDNLTPLRDSLMSPLRDSLHTFPDNTPIWNPSPGPTARYFSPPPPSPGPTPSPVTAPTPSLVMAQLPPAEVTPMPSPLPTDRNPKRPRMGHSNIHVIDPGMVSRHLVEGVQHIVAETCEEMQTTIGELQTHITELVLVIDEQNRRLALANSQLELQFRQDLCHPPPLNITFQ